MLTEQPTTDSERYRVVHNLITASPEDGGAGITPKTGEWKNVESIFPLHDHTFNKQWIKKWSTTTFLKIDDLDEIRSKFGEKVGLTLLSICTRLTDRAIRSPSTSRSLSHILPSSYSLQLSGSRRLCF